MDMVYQPERGHEAVSDSASDVSRYLIYVYIVMTVISVSQAQGKL